MPDSAPQTKRQLNRRRSPWQGSRSADEQNRTAAKTPDVGSNLRRLREERGFTIRALADHSGLAINTLSLTENGKSSPSVSTLQQLAVALDVPITAFFEIDAPRQNIAYSRANQRLEFRFNGGFLNELGAGSIIDAIQPYLVMLEANAGSGPQEIVHTGYEFVYCLEGRILYAVDGHNYLLERGDSLLFEAYLPHRWQNLGPSESHSILVLFPTDERDIPSQRHFVLEDYLK